MLVDGLLARLWPFICRTCGDPAAGMDLCIDCLLDLPWLAPGCPRCAGPLIREECAACASAPPPWDACVAALSYRYPVRELITRMKYARRVSDTRLFGELLAIAVREREARLPEAVLPVPAHPWREYRRGFSQAAEIAAVVARDTGVPCRSRLLRRTRLTREQNGLSAAARRYNVKGSFRVRGRVPRRVAVIDDVLTTGATLGEVTRVLKKAGAREVEVWVVAKAGA